MDICINMNKTASKEQGLICNYPDSKMINDIGIIYEGVDAKNE